MIPLDPHYIVQQLKNAHYGIPFRMTCLSSVSSTNTYVRENPDFQSQHIVISEEQTAGRGRLGRTWVSPPGENIYLSIGYWLHRSDPLLQKSGLSLVSGLSVVETLYTMTQLECQIKWPNDVLCDGRKIAGILIESHQNQEDMLQLIIGIGININTDTAINPLVQAAHGSVKDQTGRDWNRNDIIVHLIDVLGKNIILFQQEGFVPFVPRYHKIDFLLHKYIKTTGKEYVTGCVAGVSTEGLLRIIGDNGEEYTLASGETMIVKG